MIDKIILVFCFTMYGPHTSFISIPHSHLLNLSCYSLFSVNILGSEKKFSIYSQKYGIITLLSSLRDR